MGRAAASVCVLILLLTSGTSNGSPTLGDITIAIVGDEQVVGKPFAVRIRNNGEKRLTFCLGACGGIVVAGGGHLAPGFAVQARTRKKWNREIWSCTPGDDATSAILHGGEILEFTVKVTQPGAFRLWLKYKDVSVEDVGAHCEAIRDGKAVQQTSSDEFDVVAAPK
ncbi:MAG: hypothetical protein ABSC10_11860 [Candidatus Acidiferrales bacterium]|jgi:hypothetical protein